MTRTDESMKHCENCGVLFGKDTRNTWVYWRKAKFCGMKCSGEALRIKNAAVRPPIEEKFWSFVDQNADGCWPWKGFTDKDGYGLLRYNGKNYRAPILSLRFDGREPASGEFACHPCDNPPCVRPDHLYPGTQIRNMADAMARGRVRVGERVHFAKLSVADIIQIRAANMNSHDEIARAFGVSRPTISMILSRRTWKHVL